MQEEKHKTYGGVYCSQLCVRVANVSEGGCRHTGNTSD